MSKNLSKSPYDVVKRRHVTEKAITLQQLEKSESNPSVRACNSPKQVFIVDRNATKREIADAVQEIYHEWGVTVKAVNTITVKGKKRRMRGRTGYRPTIKKAIVTLAPGDKIEEV
jgi:large subunit ribosomal protein L23